MNAAAPVAAFRQTLETMTLRPEQRIYVEERYLRLLAHSIRRRRRIACLFHFHRLLITLGSILVPALLSIQYTTTTPATASAAIYWTTWGVSLLVTMSNGMLTMFKFDRKYYLLNATYEQLRTEGWQFLALAGHYKPPKEPLLDADSLHEYHFQTFVQTVERLYMRQMEEEYIRLQDTGPTASQPSGAVYSFSDVQKSANKDDFILQVATVVRKQLQSPEKEQNQIEGTAANARAN